MRNALVGMYAKLDRAEESLRAFDAEVARLSNPMGIGFNLNFHSGWHTVYVAYHDPLPPRFSVLVGESLYHGRSVLEHLVWALVKANKGTPGTQHTFPIWEQARGVSAARDARAPFIETTQRKQLAGVPVGAIEMIEDLQPYNMKDPAASGLAILNRMARDDRHHAIHGSFVGGRDIADLEQRFTTPPGVHITAFESLLRDGEPMVPGTKIARLRVNRHKRRSDVRMKGHVPVFIAFGESPRRVFLDDFKRINTYLGQLLPHFKQFL